MMADAYNFTDTNILSSDSNDSSQNVIEPHNLSENDEETTNSQSSLQQQQQKTKKVPSKKGKKNIVKKRRKRKRLVFVYDSNDDSDYEVTTTTSRKRIKTSQNTTHKEKTRSKKFLPKHSCDPHNNTWSSLPVEILLQIFSFLITLDRGCRYLCRCAQVCQDWYAVASQPISWQGGIADFSFMCGNKKGTDNLMEMLCGKKLMELKGLNLSGWTYLTKVGISSVAKYCRKLQYLNISNCNEKISRITADNIIELSENMNLKYINFCNSNINVSHLITLINIRGIHLKHLNFSQNLSVTSTIITSIYKNCPNLEVLNLSNTSLRCISFQTLQKSCHKLQELYLANLELENKPSNYTNNNDQIVHSGFPHLKVLSLAKKSHQAFTSYNDKLIQMILRSSCELVLLDIRGSHSITHEALQIPSTNIEQLFLSKTKITLKSIEVICHKWRETLWDLDLSWSDACDTQFDGLITHLIASTEPCKKIRNLNLAGSTVTDIGVKSILLTCLSLQCLDLTSCRGVTRGNKRCHDSVEDIKKLRKSYHLIEPDSKSLRSRVFTYDNFLNPKINKF